MESLIEMNFLHAIINPPVRHCKHNKSRRRIEKNERFSRKLNYCEGFTQDLVLNCVSNASRIP